MTQKQVRMIRKYHNHTLQTNPQHREEEPPINNSHKTLGRQIKVTISLSLSLSLSLTFNINANLEWTQCTTKHGTNTTNPTIGATNNNESTRTEPPLARKTNMQYITTHTGQMVVE